MLDRESTFADPRIVKLLKTRFVPVAIDQAYQRRQKDTEGDFYRSIVSGSPRSGSGGTTQGLYVASPKGRCLAFSNNRGPDRIRSMLEKALKKNDSVKTAALKATRIDIRFNPQPPEETLVIRVRAKILDGYEETDNQWKKIFQQAVSRDNLWISPAEHRSIVAGKLPTAVMRRIARFHLVDNTRGEPPMWKDNEVRSISVNLKSGKLDGHIHLETEDGSRGFRADVYGEIAVKDERVKSLTLLVRGDFWGEGRYTRGAPHGKFPLAVSFELADGTDVADRVPPQGSRGWVQGYIKW